MPQTAAATLGEPIHGSKRRGRRPGFQGFGQRLGQGTVNENAARLLLLAQRNQWKAEAKLLVQSPQITLVTNQKVAGVVRFLVQGQGLEGHFRADPGDVAEGDANEAGHEMSKE